jgi:hypothetical protein
MRIFSNILLSGLCVTLLSPVLVQANQDNNSDTAVVLDPARGNSSPSLDPLSEELQKKSKRLRFRDGPVCLCADGLQESDIKKATQQTDGINNNPNKNGTEKPDN